MRASTEKLHQMPLIRLHIFAVYMENYVGHRAFFSVYTEDWDCSPSDVQPPRAQKL